MKNSAIKTLGTLTVMLLMGLTNLHAQQKNLIQEVQIYQNDGFADLRQLIAAQFDYTQDGMAEGITDNLVKFDVSKDGKITNVHAEGKCKLIREELTSILTGLMYRFDDERELPYTYVMPVKIAIAAR